MKKIIKVCHIGTGRIGFSLEFDKRRKKPATHLGMWTSNRNVNLVGICDKKKINKNKLGKVIRNVRAYKNFEKMVKIERPEIVSIATWKDSHFRITNRCIDLGIKVIVLEKPLANNLKQAIKLSKKIKRKKVKVIVNHRRRFDKKIIELRKKIKQGMIGDIMQVSSYYVYGILTTGTHLIDTLRMLLVDVAGEVKEVVGFKNNDNLFCPKDDLNIDGVMVFKNNLKATIQSLNMKKYDNFDIYIYGTKGKILISEIGRSGFLFKVINSPEHEGFEELSNIPKHLFGPKPRDQFGKLAENAVDCLTKRKIKPLCDDRESLIDMKIISSLVKSSKKKNYPIKINNLLEK